MNQPVSIIDLEFGLSQLSGNRALLDKLLKRFEDEYRQFPDQLDAQLANNDFTGAQSKLHTLKGVTGNLGLNALHHASRLAENEIKDNGRPPASLGELYATLDKTLAEITQLTSGEVSGGTSASQSADKAAFVQALRKNEFIPASQLDTWLNAATQDDARRQSIREAVDELDYDTAISLLES